MSLFVRRMIRAARLDAALYEEVEADRSALGSATLVVVLSGIATGVMFSRGAGLFGLVAGTVTALASWFVWAFLTYLVGTRLLPEEKTEADVGELLRTLGFASTPGLIRFLGVVPHLGAPVFIISLLWMLAAMVVAVRQALDYESTLRAVAVCAIGWVVKVLLLWLVHTVI
ncbi:MAG: YIP1 family protein [Candidatus Eisenbacteria bacterium]